MLFIVPTDTCYAAPQNLMVFHLEPRSKCYDVAQPQPQNIPPDQQRANPFVCLDAGQHTY